MGVLKTPFIIKKHYLLNERNIKKVSELMTRLVKKIFHYYVEVMNVYGKALCY